MVIPAKLAADIGVASRIGTSRNLRHTQIIRRCINPGFTLVARSYRLDSFESEPAKFTGWLAGGSNSCATLSYQILKRGSPVLEIASAIQAFALALSAIRSARNGALSLRPPALMY